MNLQLVHCESNFSSLAQVRSLTELKLTILASTGGKISSPLKSGQNKIFSSLDTQVLSASAHVRLWVPTSCHHSLYSVSQKEMCCSSRPTSVTAQNSIQRLVFPIQEFVSNWSWFKDSHNKDFTNDPCHPALQCVPISGLICLALISSQCLLFSHPLPNYKGARIRNYVFYRYLDIGYKGINKVHYLVPFLLVF